MSAMKIHDIISLLKGKVYQSPSDPDEDIVYACAADLISDILVSSEKKRVLVTGLTTPQVIQTASILELRAVIIVRGKCPRPSTVDMSRKLGITLIGTDMTMFTSCKMLAGAGMSGID